MTSELDFIRQLQKRCIPKPPVDVGIGDDGAVLDCREASSQVVVTDMLLDGVHFDLSKTTPRLAGRKALAVNLSDLAAMACRPTAAFVSIVVPRKWEQPNAFLDELYEGMKDFTDRYHFCIAGGDTNSWEGPFAINVTLTGVPIGEVPVLRSTAQPGDLIIVTGPLGGSLVSDRHLHFEPQVATAEAICNQLKINALMDISDGLSIDLARMMEASGTGADVYASSVPIHDDVSASLPPQTRLQHALNDGEDFELLATVRNLPPELASSLNLITVGKVTEARGEISLVQKDGNSHPLLAKGWQHLGDDR